MRPESLEFLKSLLATRTPSSFERAGLRAWLDGVGPSADETSSDAYGNTVAILHPTPDGPDADSRTVALFGHADEIGMIITHLTDDGFVHVTTIGGTDPRLLLGRRVTIGSSVLGDDGEPVGEVRAVIGAPAIHLQEGEAKLPKIHEVMLDLGVSSRAEAEALVRVGDPVTYSDGFEILRGEIAVARAFDNRVGLFIVAEALRRLREARDGGRRLGCTVAAVATVQEEIGGAGAKMIAQRLRPDAALVVDVTHATDTAGINKAQHGDIRLGRGPALRLGSTNHPALVKRLEAAARSRNIKLQYRITAARTSTDGDSIFIQSGGIPTAVVSPPLRYMHTPVELMHLRDIEQTVEILVGFCLDLTPDAELRTVV